MDNRSLRYAGILAIATEVTGVLTILLSIRYSPWFSWTENYLSDLGGEWGASEIWTSRGNAGLIFNIGIFIAGSLGVSFTILLLRASLTTDSREIMGIKVLQIAMVGMCGVGVFPETTGFLHTISAAMFFILTPMSIIMVSSAMRKEKKEFSDIMMGLGILSFLLIPLLLLPPPYGRNALAETLTILPSGIAILLWGNRLFRHET